MITVNEIWTIAVDNKHDQITAIKDRCQTYDTTMFELWWTSTSPYPAHCAQQTPWYNLNDVVSISWLGLIDVLDEKADTTQFIQKWHYS